MFLPKYAIARILKASAYAELIGGLCLTFVLTVNAHDEGAIAVFIVGVLSSIGAFIFTLWFAEHLYLQQQNVDRQDQIIQLLHDLKTEISPTAPSAPIPAAPVPPAAPKGPDATDRFLAGSSKFCPVCGTALTPGTKFCASCGTQIQ